MTRNFLKAEVAYAIENAFYESLDTFDKEASAAISIVLKHVRRELQAEFPPDRYKHILPLLSRIEEANT